MFLLVPVIWVVLGKVPLNSSSSSGTGSGSGSGSSHWFTGDLLIEILEIVWNICSTVTQW